MTGLEVQVPEWFPSELAALAPRSRARCSEWSAAHRMIPAGDAAHPGLWDPSLAPYAVEVLDTINDPAVEEVTGMFGAQTGKSTIGENIVGFLVANEPCPIMWVMPRRPDYHYVHGRRIEPMVTNSPALAAQLTGRADDVSQEGITFRGCHLYYANAESTGSLKSRTVRVVILDEVDEMKDGPQGDPTSIAKQRTNTYGARRKVYRWSTPTWKHGKVFQAWEKSDRRRYWVPCHGCGRFQTLEWECVRWDGEKDPDKAREVARYVCPHCGVEWNDAQRQDSVRTGVWVPEGAEIDEDTGRAVVPTPARHRGYQLSTLYSCLTPLGDLVARFLTEDLADFTRQILALPWEEQHEAVGSGELGKCLGEYAEGEVPDEAIALTAGVDVQGLKLGLFYVVRAWGPKGESWLVKRGRVRHWAGIEEAVTEAEYCGRRVDLVFVDSGDGRRQDEVYDFCRQDPTRTLPSKGRDELRGGLPFTATPIDKNPNTGAPVRGGLKLWLINTTLFKDQLAACIAGEREPWHLPRNDDGALDEYLGHLRAEQKVRRGQSMRWDLKPGKQRNDYWDCEVLARAAWFLRWGQFGSRSAPRGEGRGRAARPRQAGRTGSSDADYVARADAQRSSVADGRRSGRREGGGGGGGWLNA